MASKKAVADAPPTLKERRAAMAEASVYVGMVAQELNEIEGAWIATHNRLRAAETSELRPPALVTYMTTMAAQVDDLYQASVMEMEAAVKAHPLYSWVKSMTGVGPRQAGRLLGAVGDPYWHPGRTAPAESRS